MSKRKCELTKDATLTTDSAEYTPSTLRDAIYPGMRPPSPFQVDEEQNAGQEEQQPPSSTPLPGFIETPDYPVPTPQVQPYGPSTRSRRRPTLRRDFLFSNRIATLSSAINQAKEKHKIKMRILRLEEEKEKQMLKQERLKTRQEEIKLEILESQLRK